MADHFGDPRYCVPNTSRISSVAIGTGVAGQVAVLYAPLDGNLIGNCYDGRVGNPTIFNVAATGSVMHLFIDLNGAKNDIDIIAFFNTNTRYHIAYYNTNAGKTVADAPVALGGADATWAQYGPAYLPGWTILASFEKFPHTYLLPTGATPAGIRFLWVYAANPYVDTSWSTTSIIFYGHIHAGPLSYFSSTGSLWRPQYPLEDNTEFINVLHRTEYGQVWSYKRTFNRRYSGDLKNATNTARQAAETLWHQAGGSHYWFPFIPDFTVATSSPSDTRIIKPVRFAVDYENKQTIRSWNQAGTYRQEQNDISLEFTEEPLGRIDLG